MMEIWKKYPLQDMYEISNKGRVRNSLSKKVLALNKHKNGYVNISLKDPSTGKYVGSWVHRLVAITHLGLIKDLSYVNHKDGNKENNCLDNLEWVSAKRNTAHARELGLFSDEEKVIATNVRSGDKTIFPSIAECARIFKTPLTSMWRRINDGNSVEGYTFSYAKKDKNRNI